MAPHRRRLLTALERVDEDLQEIESELLAAVRPKGYGGTLQDDTIVDIPDELLLELFAARRRTRKLITTLRGRGG